MRRRFVTRRSARSWLIAAAPVLVACGETTISIEDPAARPGPGVDVERGLVAYYRFDEIEPGSVVADSSGFGHDGTPTEPPPAPSLSVPPVGFANLRSLAFDGVNQLVDLGNPETLNISGDVTLAAWIRPLATDGYRIIVGHGFRWMPNGDLSLRIFDDDYEFTAWDGMDHIASAPVPPGDVDNWHHVAGVYDAGMYRLYRDGELVVEHPDDFVPAKIDSPWAVGGRSETAPVEGRYFEGLIDEVRIYARALSAEEVRALFRR